MLIRQSSAVGLDMTSSDTCMATVRSFKRAQKPELFDLLSRRKRGCNVVVGHAFGTCSDANVDVSRRYGIGNDGNGLKATATLPIHCGQGAFLRNTGVQLSHSAYCSTSFGWQHVPDIDIFDQFGIESASVKDPFENSREQIFLLDLGKAALECLGEWGTFGRD
jgi:hypothetical protein